jgi:hypothetical protein
MKLCKSDEILQNHEYLVNFKPFLLDYFTKNIKSIQSKFNILLGNNPNTQRLSINYQSTAVILDYPSITIELNTLEKLFTS